MKSWKSIVLVIGILLLVASFLAYLSRVTSCYPASEVWTKFTSEYMRSFREACSLNDPLPVQFAPFLGFFVPGVILFTVYWLSTPPRVKIRLSAPLRIFLSLMIVDSLLVAVFSMLSFPAPGQKGIPPVWMTEMVAVLGFLGYISALALWHWRRWGLLLFQGSAVALAVFALFGGGSPILTGILVLGGIVLTLLLSPVRHQME